MQVAIYARVSTSAQQKQATIDSQLRRLREAVKEQQWSLWNEHIYSDDGISGARLDRPALDRLRDGAKRGEIDGVVMLSPDRLARNYAHQWLLIEEFEKSNVRVIFLENPFGDSPQGKLLVQMQGMIAEYERAAIAERTRRGRMEKARKGEFMPWAHNCYGYRYLPKRPGMPPQVVIDETEAGIVRQIYKWVIEEQVGVRQIAKRLNERQIPTPTGKKRLWYISTIQVILTNPVYMGQAKYNSTMTAAPKQHRKPISALKSVKSGKLQRPLEEWIYTESPVVISKEVFHKAQIQLRRNREAAKRMYQPKSKRYLLRSKVKCGLCGSAVNCVSQGRSKSNYRYLYYKCLGKDPIICARESKCASRTIRAERLDALVWSALVDLLKNPDVITVLHQEWAKSTYSDMLQFNGQLESLTKRRERLEKQTQKLVDAYQEDAITLTELKSRRKKLQSDINQILMEEAQLSQHQHKFVRWQDLVSNIEEFIRLIGGNLDSLCFEDRQAIVQCLIEKVVVTGENVDIFYLLPFEEPPTLSNALRTSTENLGDFYRLRLSNRGLI